MKIIKIISLVIIIIVIGALVLTGCQSKDAAVLTDENINEAKTLVLDMVNERYDEALSANYDMIMKATFNKELIEGVNEELTSKNGKFIQIAKTSTSQSGIYNIVTCICEYENGYINLNIVFNQKGKIAGVNYNINRDYVSEDTTSTNDLVSNVKFGGEFEIDGIVTIPESDKDVPLVIIVGGSGPTDKNCSVGLNAPYYDIATMLLDEDIATLRYDKRTLTHQSYYIENIEELTLWEESVYDAVFAYEYAKTIEGVDKDRIYIAGHSLGGYAMGRIAEKTNNEAAGYILLAANVSHVEDLIIEQLEYIYSLDGDLSSQDNKTINKYREQRDNIKELTSDSELQVTDLMGGTKEYWLDLKDYNPINEMKKVTKPILVINGSRDYQVTLDEFEMWKTGLEGMNNVIFKELDGLNHLLIEGEGTPSPDEYNIQGKVSESLINALVDFMK